MTSSPLNIALIYDDKSSWDSMGLLPNESDHNIEGIAETLKALGHHVVCIDGLKALVSHLANGNHTSWDLALNIAEGMFGLAREAQVPCILEAYEVPFTFADAATTSLCLDKGRTKMVLEHFGIRTAPFAIIPARPPKDVIPSTKDDMIQRVIENSRHAVSLQQYPLFAKPIGEGTSKGIFQCNKITNPENLKTTVETLSVLYGNQDILLEPFLSGREITVGILGTGEEAKVIGANEYIYQRPPQSLDGHKNYDDIIDFAADTVKNAPMETNLHMMVNSADLAEPQIHSACQLALAAWKALGCRDAGRVDTRFDRMGDAGLPCILEVNPIPGIIPDWSDLALIATNNGLPYDRFLAEIISMVLKRSASQRPKSPGNENSTITRHERWEKYNLRT